MWLEPQKDSSVLRSAQRAFIQQFLAEILPPIRLAAKGEGYAIAVHGSLERDIDLVAIPWTEGAREPGLLLQHIRGILAGATGRCYFSAEPTAKPHGRRAWSFHHGGFHADIDLSVTPLFQKENADDENPDAHQRMDD